MHYYISKLYAMLKEGGVNELSNRVHCIEDGQNHTTKFIWRWIMF